MEYNPIQNLLDENRYTTASSTSDLGDSLLEIHADEDDLDIDSFDFLEGVTPEQILNEEEEFDVELLTEGQKSTKISVVRMNKLRKRDMLAGVLALKIAKDKGDILYKRYKKFNDKRIAIKKKLMKKYRKFGLRAARQKLK